MLFVIIVHNTIIFKGRPILKFSIDGCIPNTGIQGRCQLNGRRVKLNQYEPQPPSSTESCQESESRKKSVRYNIY